MQYRDFGKTGIQVSALGFGAMRFPMESIEGKDNVVNTSEAIKMMRHAIDEGVNYIDTAYIYHEGISETIVGQALKDGYRDRTYVATKCPVWEVQSPEDFDTILDIQLNRLDIEYIDFYLLHALNKDSWNNTVLKHNLISKMEQAKKIGKIKHIGFSFHDEADVFTTIIDAYDGWDFCQIQMNYIDVYNQATIKGLEYAASKEIGVVIMEPLLGGKLANPPINVMQALDPIKTPVEWALDYLWSLPGVSVILSGMSDMNQVNDNLSYAQSSHIGMLTPENISMLSKAKEIYDTMALVSCTKCGYCMPCPFGLDIPATFEAYNQTATKGLEDARKLYIALTNQADSCTKCRRCEKACPQSIMISEVMTTIDNIFIL